MGETGKITILMFVIALIVLLIGRILSSTALLWVSVGLFVLWVLCWVIESIFDIILWK